MTVHYLLKYFPQFVVFVECFQIVIPRSLFSINILVKTGLIKNLKPMIYNIQLTFKVQRTWCKHFEPFRLTYFCITFLTSVFFYKFLLYAFDSHFLYHICGNFNKTFSLNFTSIGTAWINYQHHYYDYS